mmetsp:Transcript_15185/g.31312  ORF Transcript_15185/g.31312 Transcript_15185/m.31312 type:complete len:219 (+) Transcript_15185:975-1631(+)
MREDGPVHARVSTPSNSTTFSVEEGQLDIVLRGNLRHFLLGGILSPASSQPPGILGRVTVSNHDLLTSLDQASVPRKRKELVDDHGGIFEISQSFEEGDDPHHLAVLGGHSELFLEKHDGEDVGSHPGLGYDVGSGGPSAESRSHLESAKCLEHGSVKVHGTNGARLEKRPLGRELGRQPVNLGILIPVSVRTEPELLRDGVQCLRVLVRLLPNVEGG